MKSQGKIYRHVAIHRRKTTSVESKKSQNLSYQKINSLPFPALQLHKLRQNNYQLQIRNLQQKLNISDSKAQKFIRKSYLPTKLLQYLPFKEISYPKGKSSFPQNLQKPKLGSKIKNISKKVILKQFLEKSLKIPCSEGKLSIFHSISSSQLICILTGPQVPLSPCCNFCLIFQINELSNGKVLCGHSNCYTQTIQNFIIPSNLKQSLFKNHSRGKTLNYGQVNIQIRSGSYKIKSFRKNQEIQTEQSEKPRKNKRFSMRGLIRRSMPDPDSSIQGPDWSPRDTFPILNPIQSIFHKNIIIN